MVKSILGANKAQGRCQSHVEYAIGLEFMRQMIVFHLRNLSKKALKGIVVKAQNG
jgi:hypothetical protein